MNRTVPCEGPANCKWHKEGFSWRWHGYLGCVVAATMEPAIFEFTAPCSDTFSNYALQYGNLRGCYFVASRPSGRPNGRVTIACRPADLQRVRLPEPFDVRRVLCHIWNVQYQAESLPAGRGPALKSYVPASGNGDGRYTLP